MPIVIPPAGITPFSTWFPAAIPEQEAPPAILADKIDPATGEYLSLEESYEPEDGAMITACRTHRGTGAAVMDVGHRLADLETITARSVQEAVSEGYRLAQHLVDAGYITLDSVTPNTDPDSGDDCGEIIIKWRNRRTGEPLTARAGQ